MAFVLNFLTNLLTKPFGYKPCDPGYENGTAGTRFEQLCFPQLDVIPQLEDIYNSTKITIRNLDSAPEKRVWDLYSISAVEFTVGSSRNCPPSTVPLGGSCYNNCSFGYEPNYSNDGKGGVIFECLRKCEQSWHPTNWKVNNNEMDESSKIDIITVPSIFDKSASSKIAFLSGVEGRLDDHSIKSGFTSGMFWCYHKGTAESKLGATEGYSSVPIGLIPLETFQNGETKGFGDSQHKYKFEIAGLYGNRRRLPLGPPLMAGICPPPNEFDNNVCYRPTPKEMKRIGNTWVSDIDCPKQYSKPTPSGIGCIPVGVYRKRYGSLLDMIIWLIVAVLIAFIVIKIIGALK